MYDRAVLAMSDLILGQGWIGPVHQLPGGPFGSVGAKRRTIVGALARQASIRPDAPFLTHLTSAFEETYSYSRANREVQRRSALLSKWGVARGERVGILGENSIDFVLVVLAALEVGAVAVPLSPRDPPARIASRAEFANVRFLFYDAGSHEAAEACVCVERACCFEVFGQLTFARGVGPVRDLPKPADGALIFFTSGTTGSPKAVVQSHHSVAQNAWSLKEHHRIGPRERLLCVLPIYHVNGLEFTVFATLLGGGQLFISAFNALTFWETVRRHEIQIASLVPNLLQLLAERPSLRGKGPLSLRYAVSAAAPLGTSVAQRVWEALHLRIVQGYGLSEVTNFSCLMPTALTEVEYEKWMLRGRRTSVGPALPGQEVRVRTNSGAEHDGMEGEIVIRGCCVMSGYLHNPEATQAVFEGGWFHTGDLGYFVEDERGRKFFHISGRMREIAKRSGAMVNLLELDEVLAAIPGISDAASVSFPNRWVDEEIAAVVVRQAGTDLSESAIIEQCRHKLPFSDVPKVIAFVREVPRTPAGKVRRLEIASSFTAWRDRLFVDVAKPQKGGDALERSGSGATGA
jgi:acyl-CoA synthetase (AMP-forming)/AMP-acid ligase II